MSLRDLIVAVKPEKWKEDNLEQAMGLTPEEVDRWKPIGPEQIVKHRKNGVVSGLKDAITPPAEHCHKANSPA
jgi:hypothetical protein